MRASSDSELQVIKREALRIYRFEKHEHEERRGPKPDLRQIVRELLIQDYGLEGLQHLRGIMAEMSRKSTDRIITEARRETRPSLRKVLSPRETHPPKPRNEQVEFSFAERPRRVA